MVRIVDTSSSLFHQFCSYTTAHGLGRFGAQTRPVGRALWLCFLLGTYAGCLYHIHLLIVLHINVPLSTSLSTSLAFEFPDVYFCPSDIVTMSRASPQVDIRGQTRALACDENCKRQMKFDMYWSQQLGQTASPQYSSAAQGLLDVILAVENSVIQAMQYDKNAPTDSCRTTSSGEEYHDSMSAAAVYSSSFLDSPGPIPVPFVSHQPCIAWKAAARELGPSRVPPAGVILGMPFAESDAQCRQPAGLPLTEFHEFATRPLKEYIGCLSLNDASEFALSHACITDNYEILTHTLCAECCYNSRHAYMGLQGSRCLCGQRLNNIAAAAAAASHSHSQCSHRCSGNRTEFCGGETAISVYRVRSSDRKPLFIPFRSSIASFNTGPYCFYRDEGGDLAATYCNVPYCPILPAFDCLALNNEGEIAASEYMRYTGYRQMTRTRDHCMDWSAAKQALLAGRLRYSFDLHKSLQTERILAVNIETPDYDLHTAEAAKKANTFCRTARVTLDAIVRDTRAATGREFYMRVTIVDSDQPVCPIAVNYLDLLFSACNIEACSQNTKSIPGLVRDRIGGALLSSRFGSTIGIGFSGCSFGRQLCTMENFTSVFHPEFGICHRFDHRDWVNVTMGMKATDASLTFKYFTDSTDSLGHQLPALDLMSAAVFPGLTEVRDITMSALKVVIVPPGQFPWREYAVTASPGQHVELKLHFDKLVRYSKPSRQECNVTGSEVTYRLPSWKTSWSLMPSALESVNLTKLRSTQDWVEKTRLMREILLKLNSSTTPMNETLSFDAATQKDCVNFYTVGQFVRNCQCLPSFLPIPEEFFPAYTYCFNRTDLDSIERAEGCYKDSIGRLPQYEREGRLACLPMCETRGYSIRLATHPWPGLTVESAADFLRHSLGDWSYPYNFLSSGGIASLFYMDIRAAEVYRQRLNASASDLLEFIYELQTLERRLAKVTVHALSDYGQQMTEEPSYTIKNLLADLGGALGLWCGISVLTVCELIELLVYLASAVHKLMSTGVKAIEAAAARAAVNEDKSIADSHSVISSAFQLSTSCIGLVEATDRAVAKT